MTVDFAFLFDLQTMNNAMVTIHYPNMSTWVAYWLYNYPFHPQLIVLPNF